MSKFLVGFAFGVIVFIILAICIAIGLAIINWMITYLSPLAAFAFVMLLLFGVLGGVIVWSEGNYQEHEKRKNDDL